MRRSSGSRIERCAKRIHVRAWRISVVPARAYGDSCRRRSARRCAAAFSFGWRRPPFPLSSRPAPPQATNEPKDDNESSRPAPPSSGERCSMNQPSLPTRPRWCRQCGSRARVVVNPYYGVGLAVHQYLSSCTRCGFVEFLQTTRRDRAEDRPTGTATEQPRRSRLAGLVRGRSHRAAHARSRAGRVRAWSMRNRASLTVLIVLAALISALAVVASLR